MRCCRLIVALMVCAGCGHAPDQSGGPAPPDHGPVATTTDATDAGAGNDRYLPGTPSWVPLIDACMAGGGSRGDCIAALPPEELAALEQWERENGDRRRQRLRQHR